MKKVMSLFLALVMIFSTFAVSVSAVANERVKYPIIFIAGSSVDLVDEDQKPISTGFDVLTDDDEGGFTKEQIIESVLNVILPLVIEGIPFDEWDHYGEALYEELAPIFEEGQLDGDGNPKFGTGVAKAEIERWEQNAFKDHGKDGVFGVRDYDFRYDWRLSPYDHVDRLHEYIKTILKTTGCKKVCLVGRCLGGNIITAYLDKYGSEKLVAKVMYDEVMSNGSSTINDCFSGKIKFSDKHIQAYVAESEYFGRENIGIDLIGINDLFLEIVERTLDLFTQVGVVDTVFGGVEVLYEKLYKAFMPAILLATGIGTWASYWTSVFEEDFDAALDLVFGKAGSESRKAYAGLIEKIQYMRERITVPRALEGDDNLYRIFENEYDVEIGVLAGYGLVQPPITESSDDTGDCTVDLKCSSFGATAAGVFDTLSDEYIAERTALGYGDFISPDKKVDASTCLFPDTTWIMKNKHHDIMVGYYIVEKFCQYDNFTVTGNYKDFTRFLVAKSVHGTKDFENMTLDNCQDGPWLGAVEQKPTLESKLVSLMRFITTILKLLTNIINGTFKIGA